MAPSDHEQEWFERLNETPPPPAGLEWERMRGGIFEKMETPPRRRPLARWWWVPLVFLLGVGATLAVVYWTPATDTTGPAAADLPARPVVEQPAPNQKTPTTTRSDRTAAVAPEIPGSGPTTTRPTPPTGASGPTVGRETGVERGTNTDRSVINDRGTDRNQPAEIDREAGIAGQNDLAPSTSRNPTVSIPDNIPAEQPDARAEVGPVSPVAGRAYGALSTNAPWAELSPTLVEERPATGGFSPQRQGSWGVQLGGLLERPELQGGPEAVAALRADSEREVGGVTAALQFRRPLGERWGVQGAIGWESVTTQLDYRAVLREFDTLLVDVPLRVNPVTGAVTRGDALTTAREVRTVEHYNRRQRLTLSLLGEYRLGLPGVRLSVQAGPEVAYGLATKGRQVDGFNQVGELAGFERPLSLGGYAGLRLGLPLGDWELSGQLGLRRSLLHERTGEVDNRRTGLLGSIGLHRPL